MLHPAIQALVQRRPLVRIPLQLERDGGVEIHAGGKLVGILDKDEKEVGRFAADYGLDRFYDVSSFPNGME